MKKLYEALLDNVSCESDPDGMNGAIDESGSNGLWDYSDGVTAEILDAAGIDRDDDRADAIQDIVYRCIKELLGPASDTEGNDGFGGMTEDELDEQIGMYKEEHL